MVTEEQFAAYEKVRASGASNMHDVKFVEWATGLDRKTIFEIMRRYDELSEIYREAKSERR